MMTQCQHCQTLPAAVHYYESTADGSRAFGLCGGCAKEFDAAAEPDSRPYSALRGGARPLKGCPLCRLSEDDFLARGEFRCPMCVSAFSARETESARYGQAVESARLRLRLAQAMAVEDHGLMASLDERLRAVWGPRESGHV